MTVFYEGPFRVGVFVRVENVKLYVAKVTFGSVPSDKEKFEFIKNYYHKLQFSPEVDAKVKPEIKNPKRKLKEAKKDIRQKGIGTKVQEALKKQHDELKNLKKEESRSNRKEKDFLPIETIKEEGTPQEKAYLLFGWLHSQQVM